MMQSPNQSAAEWDRLGRYETTARQEEQAAANGMYGLGSFDTGSRMGLQSGPGDASQLAPWLDLVPEVPAADYSLGNGGQLGTMFGNTPRTYTVRDGDNPASIGRAFFGDERAGATIMANSGLSPSVRGARGLQIGQVLTIPDSISDGNLRAGGQLIGMDAAIRAQDTAAQAQRATNTYTGMSGDEISSRYFANGGRFSAYQAEQQQNALSIAVALGGGMGVPMGIDDPAIASGMGNPVTAAIAGAMADTTMSAVRIGTAMYDNPIETAKGFIKKGINYGPEAFNAAVQITKLVPQGYMELAGAAGLVSAESAENFRSMSPYQITPLYAYNNDAQIGGSFLGDAVMGVGAAKYGDYNISLRGSSTGANSAAAAFHPGQLAAASGEVSQASILRSLRQAGTPESLASAKLISRGNVKLDILEVDPSGRGLGGLYRFGSSRVEIYRNASATPFEAAGYTTHEVTHYMQGLNARNYNLGHEFSAFRAQGAVDVGHWTNSLSDIQLYESLVSHPVYRGVRPDPNWSR